ncbi:MAG: hypothetical protein M3443_09505, partial [Actinomycetota bacterium]|nr:hypothetical protein [Actinomycetota bacterium]
YQTTNIDERNAGVAGSWAQDRLTFLDKNTWRALSLLGQVLVKADAIAGELSEQDTEIVAELRAIRDAMNDDDITPEEHATILAKTLPNAVLAALLTFAAQHGNTVDTKETRQ